MDAEGGAQKAMEEGGEARRTKHGQELPNIATQDTFPSCTRDLVRFEEKMGMARDRHPLVKPELQCMPIFLGLREDFFDHEYARIRSNSSQIRTQIRGFSRHPA
eukprot:2626636-Rhodomonas_salina.1